MAWKQEMVDGDETRVFHLITRFLNGGAEETTENTLQALQEAESYDLRLGTGAAYNRERLKALAADGISTKVFPTMRHYCPIAALVSVVVIARYLRTERIDIVHTHSTEAGIIGRIAAWLARTPVVVHEIHGDPVAEDRHWLLNAFVYGVERLCAPLATRLIVKSERIRETYLRRDIGQLEQYTLIYHGVDTDAFQQASQQERSTGSSSPVQVLFVGRLANGKGIDDLIKAVSELQAEPFHLDIVGTGPLESKLRTDIDERGLGDRVTVHGYRDDIPAVMGSADMLVLPSYREGTPRVITEARAAGLPVVATEIAGIPEMIDDGETGYLIPPGNIDALRDRLQTLIESPARRARMSERTREELERFDRQTAAECYRELYVELSSNES